MDLPEYFTNMEYEVETHTIPNDINSSASYWCTVELNSTKFALIGQSNANYSGGAYKLIYTIGTTSVDGTVSYSATQEITPGGTFYATNPITFIDAGRLEDDKFVLRFRRRDSGGSYTTDVAICTFSGGVITPGTWDTSSIPDGVSGKLDSFEPDNTVVFASSGNLYPIQDSGSSTVSVGTPVAITQGNPDIVSAGIIGLAIDSNDARRFTVSGGEITLTGSDFAVSQNPSWAEKAFFHDGGDNIYTYANSGTLVNVIDITTATPTVQVNVITDITYNTSPFWYKDPLGFVVLDGSFYEETSGILAEVGSYKKLSPLSDSGCRRVNKVHGTYPLVVSHLATSKTVYGTTSKLSKGATSGGGAMLPGII